MNEILFWHEFEEYGEFSNWYPSKFILDGVQYEHTEQYFMAQKAKIFRNEALYLRIMKTSDPKECKRLGRCVHMDNVRKWNEIKYDVMSEAVRAKFSQNQHLKARLLQTGNKLLAEASPYDAIWGIGLSAEEAKRTSPKYWPGDNLLGKILMEIRKEL